MSSTRPLRPELQPTPFGKRASPGVEPGRATSGAAMDRPQPRKGVALRRALIWAVVLGATGILMGAAVTLKNRLAVAAIDAPRLGTVERGMFRDEVPLRAQVEPLRSVQLDAIESGRVEAVFVQDGDVVEQGAPLYRLRNDAVEQDGVRNAADLAQQMAQVSVQRSALITSLAQSRRELLQLEADARAADDDLQRKQTLARSGFVSPAELDDARRKRDLAQQLLSRARADRQLEETFGQQSLAELDTAADGLRTALQGLAQSRARLQTTAPIAGQLSGFHLGLGASVAAGDRLGRIDDPAGGMQLVADIDEYYLPKLQTGLVVAGAGDALKLAQVLPQVTNGKLRLLMRWPEGAPPDGLRRGQTLDVRLQFSAPSDALLLPDGPGVAAEVYVRNGAELVRRHIQLGRRTAGQVEVLSGLAPGDQVLLSQPPSDAERFALR